MRNTTEEVDVTTYQGAPLVNFGNTTLRACADKVKEDLERLDETLKERLEWSDTDMLGAIVSFLDTQTWQQPLPADDSDDEYNSSSIKKCSRANSITLQAATRGKRC